MYVIEIRKRNGQMPYYWQVRSSNGMLLLTSEKFKDHPFRTVENFVKVFQRGTYRIVDLSKQQSTE